jgi:hypothetical protein
VENLLEAMGNYVGKHGELHLFASWAADEKGVEEDNELEFEVIDVDESMDAPFRPPCPNGFRVAHPLNLPPMLGFFKSFFRCLLGDWFVLWRICSRICLMDWSSASMSSFVCRSRMSAVQAKSLEELYHAIQAVEDNCLGCVVEILANHGQEVRSLTLSQQYNVRDFAAFRGHAEIDAYLKASGLEYEYYARHPGELEPLYMLQVSKFSRK